MKPSQRRAEAAYPYFKLATFDSRSFTFRDGKVAFATKGAAEDAAIKPGKYRLSVVTADGRKDLEPFYVAYDTDSHGDNRVVGDWEAVEAFYPGTH